MRTPEQRGLHGRWLVDARTARGYKTKDEALAALSAAGIRIGSSAYAEYEAGTKVPSRNHLPKLIEFWGAPKDERTAPDLAEAIREQTRAINDLVALLQPLVEGQGRRLDAMAPVVARLAQRVLGESPELPVRQEIEG